MCNGGLAVTAEALQDWCGRLFRHAGVPGADTELVSALPVEADLRAVFSHGTALAPQYLRWLRSGELNPKPRIRTVGDGGGSTVRMHGDGGLGHVVSTRGMEEAVLRARRLGVGVVVASHGGHNGAGFHYVEMATAEGMIGFTTQSPPPLKTPAYSWLAEGFRPPLTIGVPARDEPPVVLDLCANVLGSEEAELLMAHGPHMLDKALGREVPAGTEAGNLQPSVDAAKVASGEEEE